jgi:hypothetical protein
LTGDLSVGDSLILSETGIADTSGDSLILENNIATLTGNEHILITSPEVTIDSSDISIGDTQSTTTYICGLHAAVYSMNDLSIGAHKMRLFLNAEQGVFIDSSAENVAITAGPQKAITLDASIIKFNGKTFTPPEAHDYNHMLSVTESGDMTWSDIGGMKLLNYNGSEEKEFSFVETAEHNILKGTNIIFSGTDGSSHAVIGDSGLGNITIASVGGHTLDGSSNIEFKKIETKEGTYELVGSGNNIELISKTTFEEFEPKVAYKGGQDDKDKEAYVCTWSETVSGVATINYSNQVSIKDGNVRAKVFIMQSDRNLKTDIREDCFEKEMPSLHGFKWKDSSIQSYGFIAQELEEAGFKHLVTEHNGIKGVDYIAALSYKVAQLEQENEMLWDAIHDLQQKLNNK